MTGSGLSWSVSTANPGSPPNDAAANAFSGPGITELVTPPIVVPAAGGIFSFQNFFNLSAQFPPGPALDGMVLEISINGAAYIDIVAAGGGFVTSGYNYTIAGAGSGFNNPLPGRMAWSGVSGGNLLGTPTYITTTINLPVTATGQTITLKWRLATDNLNVPGVARIDNIVLTPASCVPVTPTPSPTPVSISGNTVYCSNPAPGPVPNVLLSLTGSASGSTFSDGSGNYSFGSLPSGGNYVVTPSKTALVPGADGINTVDVIVVQRHYLNITLIPPICRLIAADVNDDSSITTIDVLAIQRFFLGLSTGIANVGKYQFNPSSRNYSGIMSDQTGQNYDTLIFGDVASPFAEP